MCSNLHTTRVAVLIHRTHLILGNQVAMPSQVSLTSRKMNTSCQATRPWYNDTCRQQHIKDCSRETDVDPKTMSQHESAVPAALSPQKIRRHQVVGDQRRDEKREPHFPKPFPTQENDSSGYVMGMAGTRARQDNGMASFT